jgi:ferredoxin
MCSNFKSEFYTFSYIQIYKPFYHYSEFHTTSKPATRRWWKTRSKDWRNVRKTSSNLNSSITVHFIDTDGQKKTVQAPIGENIMNVAHDNEIDLEGACEGSIACSTCHVYVHEDYFDKLPEAVDEEEDMLDLAYGLTELYVVRNNTHNVARD